ncbi:MAG: zinc ribbon domain-containing protein [Prolixibacteraceae bacterium]|nr:zinc ribbon domain-containing protein [Prolixibacteraceae bacterium]
MNYCNNCGVELDVEMNYCPLCGQKSSFPDAHSFEEKPERKGPAAESESYNFHELTANQKRKVFWELSAIILASGVFVSFFIDIIISQGINWSKYPITIGLFLFVNISLICFFPKKNFIVLLGSFLATSLFLITLDLYNYNLGWGIKLGIPIIFFLYLIVFLLIVVIKKSKQKGINLIAYVLIAAGITGLCIESILSLHLFKRLELSWSIILLVSLLSASGILLFIHYRLKRVTDLKRFFHI